MPKDERSLSSRLKSYSSEFGVDAFSSPVPCKYCDVKVAREKRFNVTQHLNKNSIVREEKTKIHLNCEKFDS